MTLPQSQPKKHLYQAMFLLDNQEARKGLNAARDWVRQTLEKNGVAVPVLRFWGERRLAYKIGTRRRAVYLLGWLEATGEAVNAAKRDFYLLGPVFRCLFVRTEAIPAEELAHGVQAIDEAAVQIPEDKPEVFEEPAAAEEPAPPAEEKPAEAAAAGAGKEEAK